MSEERKPYLPPGYRLDRHDPDAWVLRRPGGWIIARFSTWSTAEEEIEGAAWNDYRTKGDDEHP